MKGAVSLIATCLRAEEGGFKSSSREGRGQVCIDPKGCWMWSLKAWLPRCLVAAGSRAAAEGERSPASGFLSFFSFSFAFLIKFL